MYRQINAAAAALILAAGLAATGCAGKTNAKQGMAIEEKTEALYEFTKQSLETIKNAGADIGMVQLGNETNGKMCGEKIWMNIYYLMDAGSRACREVLPEAKIAVHFANPESSDNMLNYASKLDYYSLDYRSAAVFCLRAWTEGNEAHHQQA